MEHVVFFPAPDGTPAFRRVAALDDAVRLVEHLRNVEGVHEVSVHPIGAEVPLAFRTWYRVEVPAGAASVPAQPVGEPAEPAHHEPTVPVDAAVPADAVVPVDADANAADAGDAAVDAAGEAAEPAVVPEQPDAGAVPGVADPVTEPVPVGANGSRNVTSLGFFAS